MTQEEVEKVLEDSWNTRHSPGPGIPFKGIDPWMKACLASIEVRLAALEKAREPDDAPVKPIAAKDMHELANEVRRLREHVTALTAVTEHARSEMERIANGMRYLNPRAWGVLHLDGAIEKLDAMMRPVEPDFGAVCKKCRKLYSSDCAGRACGCGGDISVVEHKKPPAPPVETEAVCDRCGRIYDKSVIGLFCMDHHCGGFVKHKKPPAPDGADGPVST